MDDYEWKLTIEPGRKGGPGSGHWGHAGRPGQVGGSVSGSVAMSVRTGRTARERQQEAAARGKRIYGRPPAGSDITSNRLGAFLTDGLGEHENSWLQVSDTARGKAKRQIVQRLSEMTGIAEHEMNLFIHQWSNSSNDNDLRSLSIQEGAERVFGSKLSEFQRGRMDTMLEKREMEGVFSRYPDTRPTDRKLQKMFEGVRRNETELLPHKTPEQAIDASLKAMYEYTQQELAAQGFSSGDTIRLRRGVGYSSEVAGNWTEGQVIQIEGNALESWSVGTTVANDFASGWSGGEIGVTLEMDVPTEMILSSARTGFGCLSEGEFVVLGNIQPSQARILYKWQK